MTQAYVGQGSRVGAALLAALWGACSASGETADRDEQTVAPPAQPEPESPERAQEPTTNPTPDVSSTFGDVDLEEMEPQGCQQASRSFDPRIPTVFLLVDRSDTMFAQVPGTNASVWSVLRSGVLEVIEDLQGSVRFGFAAFTGSASGTCPLLETAEASLNNYAAISTLYSSLEAPVLQDPTQKETPTLPALDMAAESLWADTSDGDKFILYVTDGQPDYCDDGNPVCPPDSVTAKLQRIAQGLSDDGTQNTPIRTLVFGLESPSQAVSVPPEILQAFANAGAGQPVASLQPGGNPNGIYDNCNGVVGWANMFAVTGKPAERSQTTADYSAVGGTAPVYRPDPTDQSALVDEIRSALATVKSCEFDLGDDGVEVDLEREDLGDKARVLLNGTPVPFDPVDGWRMLDATRVELVGSACETWRAPVETDISFDFPCDIIVVY